MDTLVLSASWEPVARITWQRAISLFLEGKVEVIEEYEDRYIRSVTMEFKVPSVIRFIKNVIRKRKAVKFSRENVYARDGGKCQYCLKKIPRHESTYDHVIPRAQGGITNWENIVIACVPCNQKKGGRTPEQAKMKLVTKPVRPKKLSDVAWRLTFTYDKNMPTSWRNYIRDIAYWHGELEEQ